MAFISIIIYDMTQREYEESHINLDSKCLKMILVE